LERDAIRRFSERLREWWRRCRAALRRSVEALCDDGAANAVTMHDERYVKMNTTVSQIRQGRRQRRAFFGESRRFQVRLAASAAAWSLQK